MSRADQTYIEKLTVKFLRAAKQQGSGNLRGLGGILLGGDPGVGKTTFVELFSDLTGINLITIEIPHIVEEHIINIPFLVYNPSSGGTQAGRSEMHDRNPDNNDEYDMVLADSHLFTQITNSRTMTDAQYLQKMTDPHPNSNKDKIAQQLFQRLGGDENTVPPAIAAVRNNFKCILFFDEYFREAPVRIRNILRDTINGNLGIHKIPSGTFIVYASNMQDAGLESIPKNTQMSQRVEFQTPTKKEWFSWMERKYKGDPKVDLKPEVVKEFKSIVNDEDLSSNDVQSEVRTSPRRWEQLLIYVNQSLPVEDSKDAKALLTNVKNNFVNYETGEHSELSKKVMKSVAKLIKATSNVNINANETSEGEDWVDNLDHHISQTMKSGSHRKYIPVVSGAPGVGKAQPLDSLIKTPVGWIQMGDIKVGTEVVTPSGDTAPVIGVYPQGEKQIYKITFADGRTTRACGDHLWKIRKDRESNRWRILSTDSIKQTLDFTNRWVYIPLIEDKTNERSLPMDPYVLGCLLGDGCLTAKSILFTSADQEILNEIDDRLIDNYKLNHQSGYDYRLVRKTLNEKVTSGHKDKFTNKYREIIFNLNLKGTTSKTKFIPEIYKNGSIQQKEELLAGLIDTDGEVTSNGAISVSTSSPRLATDVQDLVWSMGGIAKITSRIPWYTYKGEKKFGAESYKISIRYPEPTNIVKLKRKADRAPQDYQYKNLNLRVISIEEDGKEEAQCIMIDHPDHLYVTDNYVVTHNTSQIDKLSRKHNLIAVPIDTSRLNPEDVIGMPIPGSRSEDQKEIKVKFTVPQLYDEIKREIKSATKDHFKALVDQYGAEKAEGEFDKWENQEWKYLIFFDELNRVDKKTFNSLRRIILERNFGPSSDESGGVLSLPDGSVVVGAINPSQETGGTESMTGHFRDVIDVINATPSWDKTRSFLLNRGNVGLSKESLDASIFILDEFVKRFGDKKGDHSKNQAPYFLGVGDGEAIYVSPREYEALFSNMASALDDTADELLNDPDMSAEDAKEIIGDEVGEYLESGLMFPVEKTDTVAPEEFIALVKGWADKLADKVYSKLLSKKVESESSWSNVLTPYITGQKDITSMPNDSKINQAMDETSLGQFIEHVSDEMVKAFKDEDTIKKWVVDENSPKLELEDDQISTTGEKTSRLGSFIMGLLYTLQLHEYSYDRIAAVGKTLSRGVSSSLKKVTGISDEQRREIFTAAAELRGDIQDALGDIREESE